MADYTVTFAHSARKELEALEAAVVNRIFPKIEGLAKEPRPPGCLKLVAEKNLWRLRAGDYRVIYTIDDKGKVVDISRSAKKASIDRINKMNRMGKNAMFIGLLSSSCASC